MELSCSSEFSSYFQRLTRRCIPEDGNRKIWTRLCSSGWGVGNWRNETWGFLYLPGQSTVVSDHTNPVKSSPMHLSSRFHSPYLLPVNLFSLCPNLIEDEQCVVFRDTAENKMANEGTWNLMGPSHNCEMINVQTVQPPILELLTTPKIFTALYAPIYNLYYRICYGTVHLLKIKY
jgi:hypothetical protein